jgi:DNA invertase Pin-like site-specific DNA recombinase
VGDGQTMLRALGIAAELEAAMNSKRTKEGIAVAKAEGKHIGRPPFGFDSDGDGGLVPNEDYETAVAVIKEIEAGESKRSVARRADITRATVRNILDRTELYR